APTNQMNTKPQPMSISQLCQQDDQNDYRHSSHTFPQHHSDANLNNYRNGDHDSHFSSNSSSELEEEEDDDNDMSRYERPEAEQLAAEALGNMANSGNGHHINSSTTNPAPFISRMSSIPLVNSAIKAYESGKQNSKVVKVSVFLFIFSFISEYN